MIPLFGLFSTRFPVFITILISLEKLELNRKMYYFVRFLRGSLNMKNGKSKDYLSVDGGVPSSIQKSRTGNCYFFHDIQTFNYKKPSIQ